LKLVQEVLQSAAEPKALVQTASNLLSSMTQLAGLVTLPRRVHTALRQIEFLPLSDRRVLAILVLND
ncbi:MAG: heat-inducible transcriptional repressor HrcA, partial [Gammaproteobacteria bacterium]|nr:heat-inducible transcriptional repressor HrcA [Gammaproteobacteria bacterium]